MILNGISGQIFLGIGIGMLFKLVLYTWEYVAMWIRRKAFVREQKRLLDEGHTDVFEDIDDNSFKWDAKNIISSGPNYGKDP